METISRDNLKNLIDSKAKIALVDVLPKKDFEEGHLPGATSIPLETLRETAPKLLKDKTQQIITYCKSTDCPASTKAAEELESLGYTNVHEYIEGKEDWKRAGLPLEGAAGGGPDMGIGTPHKSQEDELEDGQGEASAVSTRTTDDQERMARDYPSKPEYDITGIQREGREL